MAALNVKAPAGETGTRPPGQEASIHSTHVDDGVEEVRAYQRAARRVVRDPSLTYIQAAMAILRLIQQAREADAAELVVGAILAEAWGYVTGEDRPMDREAILEEMMARDPVGDAIRAQRRKGYVDCRTCLRPLPTEDHLDHWRTLRRASLQERLIRSEAV